jgi:outer membrane protein OmpA-like peptidoglycan-associated protein/opacity protein-like surface antigen
MKKLLCALAILLTSLSQISAQDYGNTPYMGLKAGANISTFRLTSNVPEGWTNGWNVGPVGGIFGNLPVAKRLSFHIEALYGVWAGTIKKGPSLAETVQRTNYASLPVMLKFHPSEKFKILLGGEWDVMMGAEIEDKTTGEETKNKDNLRGDDFGLTGGFEFWPAYNWVIGARYIHGLTDVSKFDPQTRRQTVQITLGYRFGKKAVPVVVAPVPVVIDTDNDGIADPADKCPTVPGLAKYDGCPIPDTDKDGINDEEDKCPTVAGLAKYKGCPIPDTDGDGINDEEDKCPTVAGLARYQGCPIPDTDGDGVNDEEDRCPDVPGVIENKGCPKIDFQASDVTFQSGKAILLAAGKKELDVLADLLKKNPTVRVSLEGHTDNSGTDKVNDPLSVKRAEAAETYLVSKGIEADRMETAGFGSKVPVADNKTAAGKKLNRRVEVKIL